MIRVLVILSPRMYREAVALSVQRNRPGLVDVRLAPPEAMEAEIASFRPHLLIHDDTRGDPRRGFAPIPEAALEKVPHRLEVLYSDGMDARISADGVLTELPDASTDDLLSAVDATGLLADREMLEGQLGSVVLRVEVLYTDGMAALISMGGRSYKIEDASMDDLLSLVDEVEEGLVSG